MESKIRTFQELDYFERHIADILMKKYNHERNEAIQILNEYSNVLGVLKDGHETANAFAEMFEDAYRKGTSGDSWVNNILDYLMEQVGEIHSFRDLLDKNNSRLIFMSEGVRFIRGEKYLQIYAGESQETHIVRWNTFYVKPDMSNVMVMDFLTGDPMSIEAWRDQLNTINKM